MQLVDTTLMEQLKDDNFKLKEGQALIYKDEDLIEYMKMITLMLLNLM